MSGHRANGQIRLTWDDPVTGEAREWAGSPPVRIGRTADNEIALNAGTVSRRHAQIERDGANLVVVDQGSSNGTLVDGGRVSRAALADGVAITVGPFTLSVALDGTGARGTNGARPVA